MKNPGRKILSLLGESALPAGGLLCIFLLLTTLYGIQQVLLDPDLDWNNCLPLIVQTFVRVITFRCQGQISNLIIETTWRTLVLVSASITISFLMGILIATCQLIAGSKSIFGRAVNLLKIVASPFPSYLLGLMVFFTLRIIFGRNWPQGEVTPGMEFQGITVLLSKPGILVSYLLHLVPPATVLALADGNLLYFIETIRQRSVQINSSAHIRYLTDSGYRPTVIIFKHIIPHTLVDLVYVLKYRFTYLISSAAVVELIFSRPGISSGLVQAIINGRGSFEYVVEAVWFLSIVVLILVVIVELLRNNASWLIVRGYYPVARTTYDTLRQLPLKFSHLFALCIIVIISTRMAQPVYAESLFDDTVSLPPFIFHWAEIGSSIIVTMILVSCTTVLTLVVAVAAGTATGLLRGSLRRCIESGVNTAFDLVPKFFVIFIMMTVISAIPFFEGSANRWHAATAYCFVIVLFCWNETARSIAHRMREVERSGAFASATAIGCSMLRKLAVYYYPAIRREATIGALKIFLTVLFLESALAYCGGGLSRWVWNAVTIAGSIHTIINNVLFIPPYGPVLLRYTPAMVLGLLIVVAVATVNYIVEKKSNRETW